MLNIGIDIDNTICNTEEYVKIYEEKYLKENNITEEVLWNDNNYKLDFLNKYLYDIYTNVTVKDNVSKVINNLSNNNKIFIITARSNHFIDNVENLIIEYSNKYNIKYDKIIIHAGDKLEACQNNNIDIMIDDNYYNYSVLKENNIKCLLFDDKNRYLDNKDRVSNWNEIEKILN